jgi:hypothetical protein
MTITPTALLVPADGSVTPAKIASGDFYFDTNTLYVDSTNNRVGIGTSSPSSLLHLSSAGSTVLNVEATGANDSRLRITSGNSNTSYVEFADPDDADTGEIRYEHATNNMQFRTAGNVERMRIDSSGNVGIGTTAMYGRTNSIPKAAYNAAGTNWAESAYTAAGSWGGGYSLIDGSAGYLLAAESAGTNLVIRQGTVGSTPTERMRIDSSGNLLVGQTAQNYNVVGASIGSDGLIRSATTGQVTAFNRKGSHGAISVFYKDGVTVGSISTNANSLPSDRNFKRNIQDLTLGLDFVASLNPVTYNYKLDEEGQPVMTGLIAQEVEESLTAAGVEKNSMTLLQHTPTDDVKESDYQMDYLKLVPILINSIKEQQTLIESLTSRIAALEE